jgi:hypothetical protein
MVGARRPAKAEGVGRLPGVSSYFRGGDPRKWHTGIPTYRRLRFSGIYPGIDAVVYGNQRLMETDYVVSPGRNPGLLKMKVDGARALRLTAKGDLDLVADDATVTQRRPVAYQTLAGKRQPVPVRYAMLGRNEVGIKVGRYDHGRPLIIDPVLTYGTYLGGTGIDAANAIAVDAQGNAYVTGRTSSLDFPTNPPTQGKTGKWGDSQDAFVTKLSPNGSQILYSAYLGGGNKDEGMAIQVDAQGATYVAGWTDSKYEPANPAFGDNVENPGFPTTQGAYDPVGKAYIDNHDAFILKINPEGTSLVYSTYLGDAMPDQANGIAVAADGSVVVVGMTRSSLDPSYPEQFRDFPTTDNALQRKFGGGDVLAGDAFVARLSADGSTLLYSTYLGGKGGDTANAVALDRQGNIYVAGRTGSDDFPATNGAFQTRYVGGGLVLYGDAFVTKLDPTGTRILYSTYLGGGDADEATAIAVDTSGSAVVAGYTYSSPLDTPFPTTAGTFQPSKAFDPHCPHVYDETDAAGNVIGSIEKTGYCNDGFVAKLGPDGSSLVYSTHVGGNQVDQAQALALDPAGDAYVGGWSKSSDLIDPGAPTLGTGGDQDGFLIKLDPTGHGLFLVKTGMRLQSIAVGAGGAIYLAGIIYNGSLQTTPGVAQPTFGGSVSDGFVMRIQDGDGTPAGGPPGGPPTTAGVPTSDQYTVAVTGGSIKLYAGQDPELHLLVRAIPKDPSLPDAQVPVEIWGPDGNLVVSGQLRLVKGGGLVDLIDVGSKAVEGDYQARLKFADKELTFVFEFMGDPKVAEPRVQASAPADGSLALTWAAVPGALGYWVQLYGVTKDQATNNPVYTEIGWSSSHGQTSFAVPAGSLKAGSDYAALVYPLTLDPDATPLANGFWGNVTEVDFKSGASTTTPPPTQLPGDLDGDGKQDIRDVITMLKMVAGLTPVTDPAKLAGDMNADGKLDIRDVVALLRKVAGL